MVHPLSAHHRFGRPHHGADDLLERPRLIRVWPRPLGRIIRSSRCGLFHRDGLGFSRDGPLRLVHQCRIVLSHVPIHRLHRVHDNGVEVLFPCLCAAGDGVTRGEACESRRRRTWLDASGAEPCLCGWIKEVWVDSSCYIYEKSASIAWSAFSTDP